MVSILPYLNNQLFCNRKKMFQDVLNGLLNFPEALASESRVIKGGKGSEIESKVYKNQKDCSLSQFSDIHRNRISKVHLYFRSKLRQ